MALRDSWRFAVGTFTAIPVRRPSRVDPAVCGVAMVLAPLAVAPLGLVVALTLWAGIEWGLSPLPVAALALGLLAIGNRALHLDGLADTVDGLAASYERERALAVMRTGDVGPAGAVALVVVLLMQWGGLVSLAAVPHGPWIAGGLVCASRAALAVTCMNGVPAARRDGLGSPVAGTVPPQISVAMWLAVTAVLCAAFSGAGLTWWTAAVVAGTAVSVVALVTWHCVRRLGGVTGDVYGAAVELALAAMLLTV